MLTETKRAELESLRDATLAELDGAPSSKMGTPWWSERIAVLVSIKARLGD
jgi:hypothetical protein